MSHTGPTYDVTLKGNMPSIRAAKAWVGSTIHRVSNVINKAAAVASTYRKPVHATGA